MATVQRARSFLCLAACASLLFTAHAEASEFTLEDAIQRVAKVHPQLKIFDVRQELMRAEVQAAGLRPALGLGLELENVAGDAPYSGTSQAEYTLTLAGVLERGMKREARRAVAARRLDMLGVERAASELDLLAEVNRRYLDVLEIAVLQPQLQRASQRQQNLANALRQRFLAGGVTEAVVLSAEAELARLNLESTQAIDILQTRWQHLAVLWGETATPTAIPDLSTLPTNPRPLDSLPEVLEKIKLTPDIAYFASASRIHDAQLRLIESQRSRDIQWQVGVRRLAADSSNALVAGVSVPLGQRVRADIESVAERARERERLLERDALILRLESLLIQIYAEVRRDHQRLALLEREIVPKLKKATEQGQLALQEGALTYSEFSYMQREWLMAERDQLSTRIAILKNMIEMQRLTAESWSTNGGLGGDRQ